MSNLNQQYFDSKDKHRKSVYKHAWLIWGALAVIGIIWVYNDISQQINRPLTEEKIVAKTGGFKYVDSDYMFICDNKDFKILIKSGHYFGQINNDMPLMIISKDSTETLLFVKKAETDNDYESLIQQWESKITKTDSTYKFGVPINKSIEEVSKEIANLELTKEGKTFLGKILICQHKNNVYIIQGISKEDAWSFKKTDINEMINSFRIE